jgi:hypothetical protein
MDMAAQVIGHPLSSGSLSIRGVLRDAKGGAPQSGRRPLVACSKRPLLADHHEAFSLSGACQANIEAHKFQRHGIVIGRDQCRCELQTVGSA